MDIPLIKLTEIVTNSSNDYENTNTELKRKYLIRNIEAFNKVVSSIDVYKGSFGTGYPFYVLQKNLTGQIPIIPEQIRYNNELLEHANKSKRNIWTCRGCISKNHNIMPDLKQVCKPCPNMDDQLKPRKLINRLPDLDMWMICQDGQIDRAEEELANLLDIYNIRTSDVDPVQTIMDMETISQNIKNGIMPKMFLPIDAHIIEYSKIRELIKQVPSVLQRSLENGKAPYLPIHPKSYRKKWQYDDEAYNFIYDFLASFTGFNLDSELEQDLNISRKFVAKEYSPIQQYRFLYKASTDANKRRNRTPELVKTYLQRIQSWGTESQNNIDVCQEQEDYYER